VIQVETSGVASRFCDLVVTEMVMPLHERPSQLGKAVTDRTADVTGVPERDDLDGAALSRGIRSAGGQVSQSNMRD